MWPEGPATRPGSTSSLSGPFPGPLHPSYREGVSLAQLVPTGLCWATGELKRGFSPDFGSPGALPATPSPLSRRPHHVAAGSKWLSFPLPPLLASGLFQADCPSAKSSRPPSQGRLFTWRRCTLYRDAHGQGGQLLLRAEPGEGPPAGPGDGGWP